MDKHISQDIKARLEGFPEEKIPELIDYIESLRQTDKANTEERQKTPKQEGFPEAGP